VDASRKRRAKLLTLRARILEQRAEPALVRVEPLAEPLLELGHVREGALGHGYPRHSFRVPHVWEPRICEARYMRSMQVQQFGRLRARLLGGSDGRGGGDGPLVVLLHGYGAPGDDLVALAQYLRLPTGARVLFPEAPLALDFGGRAWWLLDPMLFERRARGERIDRSEEVPERLVEARAELMELLEQAASRLSVAPERMVLGGFSQGSMLACDVALHAQVKPAGLILLSSTLLARAEWERAMPSCRGLPILQSHGRQDPLLDFGDAERLRELFEANGAELTFVDFDGGHELPPMVLRAAQSFIERHAK